MVIETDARRYIVDSIATSKEILLIEHKNRPKSLASLNLLPNYVRLKAKLIAHICEINSIANTQGKGRDDFTIDVLKAAEELCLKHSLPKSVK